MARIKIIIPGKIIFSVKIPVRINDINYGNHLGNDALVGIIHEARVQWLQHLTHSELNIDGVGLIMAALAVEYKKESFYGDILVIDMSADEISKVSFNLYYSILNQQNVLIANAKTEMVCYNYSKNAIAELPEKFKQMLQHESNG
ncbi:MAG: acyl-CoA thioesterase [Ferruginibacter sp.]